MSLRFKIMVAGAFLLFFSCAEQQKFPPLKSQKTPTEHITIHENLRIGETIKAPQQIADQSVTAGLNKLSDYIAWYKGQDEQFSRKEMEAEWTTISQKIAKAMLDADQFKSWMRINGFLLQLTGRPKYAAELERWTNNTGAVSLPVSESELQQIIAPYIFTRDIDNVFINLFINSTLDFEHSLFGDVSIEQKTDPEQPAKVQVNFSLAEKKYMELYIRIPVWAKHASVTVKKVKYVATPGAYCKIAKKWKEGDVVHIRLEE